MVKANLTLCTLSGVLPMSSPISTSSFCIESSISWLEYLFFDEPEINCLNLFFSFSVSLDKKSSSSPSMPPSVNLVPLGMFSFSMPPLSYSISKLRLRFGFISSIKLMSIGTASNILGADDWISFIALLVATVSTLPSSLVKGLLTSSSVLNCMFFSSPEKSVPVCLSYFLSATSTSTPFISNVLPSTKKVGPISFSVLPVSAGP